MALVFVSGRRTKTQIGKVAISIRHLSILLICCGLLISQISLYTSKPVSAQNQQRILNWGIVDTPAPGLETNIVVASEINHITISSDDRTFYAVDIPNQNVFKTTDAGITWPNGNNLTGNLLAAGAQPPTWNIAVAPDDVDFLVAITDGNGAPNGPKNVFVSIDGGQNWQNSNVTLPLATDFISCVAISE